jgi:long-subunit acyl-CoA synthetase (AMP-forming)
MASKMQTNDGISCGQGVGCFTIPYTSGTTGKPKGVLVPHRSRVLTLFGMAVRIWMYSPEDRFLAMLQCVMVQV